MLARSFQPDTSDGVHAQLFHASKDMFDSYADPADFFIKDLIDLTQWFIPVSFAHQKIFRMAL